MHHWVEPVWLLSIYLGKFHIVERIVLLFCRYYSTNTVLVHDLASFKTDITVQLLFLLWLPLNLVFLLIVIPKFYGVEFPYSYSISIWISPHIILQSVFMIISDLMIICYVTLSPSFSLKACSTDASTSVLLSTMLLLLSLV